MNRKAIATKVRNQELIVAPGIYDLISAKMADRMGFDALYVTGYGLVASYLGLPDAGLATYTDMLHRISRMCEMTETPIMADADTGYGGLLNVAHTVKGYEKAGVAAIQIEDQAWPKKCGHEPGRRVVDIDEMVGRIKAAVDARDDDQLAIIARTDARTSLGIDVAIERALRYQEAGADVVFVESPESEAEMQQIHQHIKGPTLANMVEGGRTPVLPAAKLQSLGYSLAIYPNSLTRMIANQGANMLSSLKQTGSTAEFADRMVGHRGLWDLFDYPEWTELERKFVKY